MSEDKRTIEDRLDERNLNLMNALVKAQRTAKEVTKSSENKYHGYGYASAEAIIAEARDALGQHGLAVVSSWTVSEGRVNVVYTLIHEFGGRETFQASTPILPEKGRPVDKAEATALTYNMGYFLRGLLLLPRVEKGTEVDDRDDSHHEPPQPPRTTKVDVHLNATKIEFSTLLSQMPKEKQEKIKEWLKTRDNSFDTYTKAIVSMKKELSQKQNEDVLSEMDPYPEG